VRELNPAPNYTWGTATESERTIVLHAGDGGATHTVTLKFDNLHLPMIEV